MIRSVLKVVVPGAALLSGLAVAAFLGARGTRSEASANADIAERFSGLPIAEQEGLLVRAKLLTEIQEDEDQTEWERLQRLHADVKGDPSLGEKLERYHAWWTSLDTIERQRIFPDRTFGDNWAEEVQLVYAASDVRKHQISVRIWSPGTRRDTSEIANFTEESYERFLEQVLPTPLPPALEEKVGLYEKGCDRNLFLTVFLLRESRRQQQVAGGRQGAVAVPAPAYSMAVLKQAAIDHLVSSEYAETLRNLPSISVMPFLKAAFDHYGEQFRQKHLVSQEDELLSLYEGLDRKIQLELMKTDGEESRKELKNLLITKLSSENPAIAELAKDAAGISRFFEEMKRMFEWSSRPGGKSRAGSRGGFGGNRPPNDRQPTTGGSGDRRDEGRGPRGPEDRRPEGGPPRNGERPPESR